MADLTLAELKRVLHYDPSTGYFTWKVRLANKWPAGTVAGGRSKTGHIYIAIYTKRYLAHRLAWFYMNGQWPRLGLDHKNCDPSDNRIINLREATQAQNMANVGTRCDSSTGYKGVRAKRNKWQASIMSEGKQYFLGVFDTPELAHSAYIDAAKRLHGEFARWLRQ